MTSTDPLAANPDPAATSSSTSPSLKLRPVSGQRLLGSACRRVGQVRSGQAIIDSLVWHTHDTHTYNMVIMQCYAIMQCYNAMQWRRPAVSVTSSLKAVSSMRAPVDLSMSTFCVVMVFLRSGQVSGVSEVRSAW